MKYVGIVCYVVAVLSLCAPASAGSGNALAGGWNSDLTGAARRPGADAHPASRGGDTATSSGGGLGESFFDLGSGGGASHASGGAPSPEINALLGLLLAGGTVALLRRRTGRAGSDS